MKLKCLSNDSDNHEHDDNDNGDDGNDGWGAWDCSSWIVCHVECQKGWKLAMRVVGKGSGFYNSLTDFHYKKQTLSLLCLWVNE